jgi:hypothetical protein
MRKLVLSAHILASAFQAVRAESLFINNLGSGPFLMTSGNTYSFAFNNIGSVSWSSTSSVLAPNSSGFYVSSYTDVDALVSPPDSWTIRMYQTSTASDANLFAILGNTASYTTTNPYSWSLNGGVSTDSGGALQVVMNAGTAQVSEIGINVVKDGTLYQKVYAFAVPEPSVASMLIVGGLALAIRKRRK